MASRLTEIRQIVMTDVKRETYHLTETASFLLETPPRCSFCLYW